MNQLIKPAHVDGLRDPQGLPAGRPALGGARGAAATSQFCSPRTTLSCGVILKHKINFFFFWVQRQHQLVAVQHQGSVLGWGCPNAADGSSWPRGWTTTTQTW